MSSSDVKIKIKVIGAKYKDGNPINNIDISINPHKTIKEFK